MSTGDTINPQLVDRKGRLWQERTVVVKKETDGFGFTLSKQMPVFVERVFQSSSADRAGILPGDRIIKVNGTSVVSHKHEEVVGMIRDCSHVTLTVIGKLGHNGTKTLGKDSGQNIEISPPRQLQELTLQSLKMMLQRQRKNYESLSVEYGKQPADKLEKELKDCESIIKILELEISSKSPAIESHIQTTSASVQMLTGKSPRTQALIDERALTKKLLGGSYRDDDLDNGMTKRPTSGSSPSKYTGHTMHSSEMSPKPTRAHTFSNGTAFQSRIPRKGEIHISDGSDGSDNDLSDEVDGASDAGPFSSLQELKGNPAHMAVFLHYLIVSKEPKYLLFYLVASSYQANCNTIEMLKQRGMDIYWTFFLETSPLPLEVENTMKQRILSTLESEESESKLKSVFVEARESLTETIISDLANYRHKRVMGLAGMFGDHLLSTHMTPAKHIEVLQTTLATDLKQCLDDKFSNGLKECSKSQAIAACMTTFMLDAIATTGGNKTGIKTLALLEKIQSFTRADMQSKKGKKKKQLTVARNGHVFQLTTYKTPTVCDLCGTMLWGVMYHGYQCTACEINIHRYSCINEVAECAGQIKHKQWPRKMSAHRLKTNLINAPEETDSPDVSVVNNKSATEEGDEERLSPAAADSGQSPGIDSEGESVATMGRRNRSVSEPKAHMLLIHSSSVAPVDLEPPLESPRKKEPLARAFSERLHNKPESVQEHLAVDQVMSGGSWYSSSSFSDDSQIGSSSKVNTLDSNAEVGGPTSGSKLPVIDEDIKELLDDEIESERIPWALKAKREVLQGMKRYESERQENIRELLYTERTHLQKLKIMRYMYKIPLQKQGILTAYQAEQLFPSLEELILFHSGLCTDLKERIGPVQNDVCKNIADVLLKRFDGAAGERLCHACSVFASSQAKADKQLKEWRRKNDRFRLFLKTSETHPLCHRLTLTELMPTAWTRLMRYKLLIEKIIQSYRKHWSDLDDEDKKECQQVENAFGCVKNIAQYVNKQVRKAEDKQRRTEFQSKMDLTNMDKSQHPIAKLFKNLDLTTENRRLIHEGPLTWRIQHRKVVELYALLLSDILVLLEKHEDKDKYYLRCHTVETVSGSKEELSPVIRLQDCLLRHAAHDRGNRTFLVVNNSNLMKLAQMYEFIAEGPQEKKQWEEAIKRAMMGTQDIMSPELPSSPIGEEFHNRPSLAHLNPREQLDKIDDDMKKLMMEKLNILRAMQGGIGGHRSSESTPQHTPTRELDSTKAVVWTAIEQAGEITSTVSHIMVPNPTKSIIAEAQARLTTIISELQKNLSRLLIISGQQGTAGSMGSMGSIRSLDLDLNAECGDTDVSSKDNMSPNQREIDLTSAGRFDTMVAMQDVGSGDERRRDSGGNHSSADDMINIPSPIPEVDEVFNEGGESDMEHRPLAQFPDDSQFDLDALPSATSLNSVGRTEDGLTMIVPPPDTFLGDESATPTPGMDNDYIGVDSGKSTPRLVDSPSVDSMAGKMSPLVVATQQSLSVDTSHSETQESGGTIRDALQPLSPLAMDRIVAMTTTENSTNSGPTDTITDSSNLNKANGSKPTPKVMSVYSSNEHDSKPAQEHRALESIPSFSLSRMSTSTSLESHSNGASEEDEGTNL